MFYFEFYFEFYFVFKFLFYCRKADLNGDGRLTVEEIFAIFKVKKVVIFVCLFVWMFLFVCPIIPQEPLDRFASNFNKGTTGLFSAQGV